jgi:signal transduction histidine kinase
MSHLKKVAGAKQSGELVALKNAVEFLKDAANQALRYGRAWDQPEFQQVNVVKIMTRLKELYRDGRLRWLIHPTPELRANPWLIEQIVVELVINALRFAPKKSKGGKIVVKVSPGWMRTEVGRRRRAAVIQVKDNGPGVARNQKQSIFQPYRSVEESRLGLGLSIVMRAVRAHGGLVDECGREGRGACFRVLLPVTE